MSDAEQTPPPAREQREGEWAGSQEALEPPPNVSPDDAPNIEGRRPQPPHRGFGQLWQKEYRVALPIEQPAREVMDYWKQEFGNLWPPGHRYTGSLRGVRPGEVSVLDIPVPGGSRLSSGVRVLHVDDTSFTLQTAEGHMLAGWIEFSVDGQPRDLSARALVVMRANDPLYEVGLRLGGHEREDEFWSHALRELALQFGVEPRVSIRHRRLDHKVRWRAAGNVVHNAWLHTLFHRATLPARRVVRRLRGRPEHQPAKLDR